MVHPLYARSEQIANIGLIRACCTGPFQFLVNLYTKTGQYNWA